MSPIQDSGFRSILVVWNRWGCLVVTNMHWLCIWCPFPSSLPRDSQKFHGEAPVCNLFGDPGWALPGASKCRQSHLISISQSVYLNVCFPLNLYAKILSPKVMVERGEAFGRWNNHENGTIMNEISALMKEAWERPPLPLPLCEDTRRRPHLNQETGSQ